MENTAKRATGMTESSADAFLTSLRLADSFLPVGAYTASYGIEQFIQTDRIDDAADLRAVLDDYLRSVVGPAEIVALGNAHTAAAREDGEALIEIDRRLHSMTVPAEFRESSEKAGEQVLSLFDGGTTAPAYLAAVEDGRAPGNYVVALAAIAQQRGLSREQACLVHGYSFVTDLLGAAQRLGRLAHTDIQRILDELRPVLTEVVDRYHNRPLDAMWSFAPTTELMGMGHERADRRLFMS